MKLTVETLLSRLDDTQVVELLEAYDHLEYHDLWDQDDAGPRLYRAFSRSLIDQGFSTLALKLARRGLESYANDSTLSYMVALAYARGGNVPSAEQALAPLMRVATPYDSPQAPDMTPQLRVEVISLRGRLYKDQYQREKNPVQKKELARKSAQCYLQAAELPGENTFPLINAATMQFLSGEADRARTLARRILDQCLQDVDRPARAEDFWLRATLGEAYVLLDDHANALRHYRAAADCALSKGAVGAVVSMLGNVRLLSEAGACASPAWLQERLGSVIVFSGHRIDPPLRTNNGQPPRFPNDAALTERVKEAIRHRLQQLNARFGFCSLASGSDILFAEAMLERGADLQVILPFARDDFLRTSVDYGQVDDPRWLAWRHRFEAVLAKLKPDHLHYATSEPYLGTELLFDYANTFIQGLAIVRARQCLISPIALVVLDPCTEHLTGGTGEFLARWKGSDQQAEVIDLAGLREKLPAQAPMYHAVPAEPPPDLPRVIRAMLFADVAGFSKMDEEQAPQFFARFPQAVARVLAGAGKHVLLANTWGDGFFAVFERVANCAAFALEMLERVGRDVDWSRMGFPDANPLRVGLHAGPVFELADDPILHRVNFFGNHVNRAARIEPVTIPGCAFASEQFAALLTVEARDAFRCELIGVEKLPKKSGNVALYRISRP